MQKAILVINTLLIFITLSSCQALRGQELSAKQRSFFDFFEDYWRESDVYVVKEIENNNWFSGSVIDNELKTSKFTCLYDGIKLMEWQTTNIEEKEIRNSVLLTPPKKWNKPFTKSVNKHKSKRKNRLVKLGYPLFFNGGNKALTVVLWDQSTEVYFFELKDGKWQKKCYTLLSIS